MLLLVVLGGVATYNALVTQDATRGSRGVAPLVVSEQYPRKR